MQRGNTRQRSVPRRLLWLWAPLLLIVVGAFSVSTVSAQATGTVRVQKQLVSASTGQPITGPLNGYQFTLSCAAVAANTCTAGASFTLPTDATGVATFAAVPVGTYTITEQPGGGVTQVVFFINGAVGSTVTVAAGATVNVTAVNSVQGTSTLTITKQIVDANNNPLAGQTLSGYSFTVTGPSGVAGVPSTTTTATTDTTGQAVLPNLAAGLYTVAEQPAAGFMLVRYIVNNAVVTGASAQVTLLAGQPATVVAQNRQGSPTGTVTVTKTVADVNGNILASADRSGFQFTITCGTGASSFTQQMVTDATGTATFNNVPAGTCQIAEASRTGYDANPTITVGNTTNNIGNPGAFLVNAGATTTISVRNQKSATPNEQVALSNGCNNESLTFPTGTPTSTVAQNISPAGGLVAIWFYQTANQRFVGYSPIPNAPNDLQNVNLLQAVFICMNQAGTLSRPAISAPTP